MNTFEKTQKNIIEEMANSDQSATQLEEKKDEKQHKDAGRKDHGGVG